MPQLCTVCTHAQSREIDSAIIGGKLSNRVIARQFEGLNPSIATNFEGVIVLNRDIAKQIASHMRGGDLPP